MLGEPRAGARPVDLGLQPCRLGVTLRGRRAAVRALHSDPRWSQVLDCLKLPADAPARKRR